MRLGIQTILALTFALASLIPLGFWAISFERFALEREIEEVADRHLLVAQNLSRALERYAVDAAAVFSHVVENNSAYEDTSHLSELLASMGFVHICRIDTESGRVLSVTVSPEVEEQIILPPLDQFIEIAQRGLGQLVFTDVMQSPNGAPAIYLVRDLEHGQIALGQLNTRYVRDTQSAIAFGEGGHAAVVDASGNVIGHPNSDWVEEVRNISRIDPVARMMRGETGVSNFYSPAAETDMIAGFTTVPRTGWGVMIPQPFSELENEAAAVRRSAIGVLAAGTLGFGVLGWLLGGLIARPIRKVTNAAEKMAEGAEDARVESLNGIVPTEVSSLAARFNEMIRALEQARAAQSRAVQAALDASQAKSDFVARVTHELRTPLNTVIGFSGMIRDQSQGPLGSPEYVEYARMIHQGGQRLLAMVNDIIAYASVDGRSEALSEQSIDVKSLAQAVISVEMPLAEERRVRIELQDGSPDIQLWGDELKLRHALSHVVNNAVKFSEPDGNVRVSAGLADDGACIITVEDTGIGIRGDDIELALSPFGQVSITHGRSHEGAGLGLPLAQLLLELHGGSLTLTSEIGEGTTVALRIPAERVGGSNAEAAQPSGF